MADQTVDRAGGLTRFGGNVKPVALGQWFSNRLGQAERSAQFTAQLLKRSGIKIPDDERSPK
jgi:hypothetical protein